MARAVATARAPSHVGTSRPGTTSRLPPFVQELPEVQDAMPGTPFADVRRIVEAGLSAWGYPAGTTLEDAFSRFEPRPIASASIAQVHRAVLRPPCSPGRGGRRASAGSATAPSATRARSALTASLAVPPDHLEVVVKVRHPGNEPMMLQDAFNLRVMLSAVACLEIHYDLRPVLSQAGRGPGRRRRRGVRHP